MPSSLLMLSSLKKDRHSIGSLDNWLSSDTFVGRSSSGRGSLTSYSPEFFIVVVVDAVIDSWDLGVSECRS